MSCDYDYAISVDDTFYAFQYSPLGVPARNMRWIPRPRRSPANNAVASERVQFHCLVGDEWKPARWPRHLWWVRFFITAHDLLRGTRWKQGFDFGSELWR